MGPHRDISVRYERVDGEGFGWLAMSEDVPGWTYYGPTLEAVMDGAFDDLKYVLGEPSGGLRVIENWPDEE